MMAKLGSLFGGASISQQQAPSLPPNPAHGHGNGAIQRIPQPDDNDPVKSKNVLAVVVTVNDGSSYDPLFTDHPQEMQDGVVRVYKCSYSALPVLRKYLTTDDAARAGIKAEAESETLGVADELVADVAGVAPDAVVLNYECCGGCGDKGFPSSREVLALTRVAVDRGFMSMFSDFSLKALIGAWDAALMGPNPFVKTGELQSQFQLRFDTKRLQAESCPSEQLTKVAELCKDGTALVGAMGGTIMYSVKDGGRTPAGAPYELEVLTLCAKADGHAVTKGPLLKLKGVEGEGVAGHVALRYPSGGVVLTSCGHWVSLSHLDTSEANLKEAVTKQMGAANYAQWETEYRAAPQARQASMMQKKAAECVMKSAPCKYSSFA